MSQDREFEKYLEGKTDLSKLYAELPKIELPDHLDAAILAEAHRAVNARPSAKPKRNWSIPLGLVATLFMAVIIGLQLPAMLKNADQVQQLKEERMSALMDKGLPETSSATYEDSKKTQDLLKVTPGEISSSTLSDTAAKGVEMEVPVRQILPSLAAPAPVMAVKSLERREDSELDSEMTISKESKSSRKAQGNLSNVLEQQVPSPTMMAAPSAVQLNRSPMKSSKDEAINANLTPEQWLVRIKQLKQDGMLDEAQKDLEAFKKNFPDYPVPKEL